MPMIADLSPPIDLAREPDFELGGLLLRPSLREIGAGEARETLEPRVVQVLVALARRLDQVVSREDLVAACWGGRIVGDDAINRCIAKVRRVGEARGAFTIETIPRVGYRLGLGAGAPAAAPRRRWLRPAAYAGLAALVAAGAWLGQDAYRSRLAGRDPRTVVLPFKALTSDAPSRALAGAADTEVTGWLNEDHLQTLPPAQARDAAFTVSGAVQGDGTNLRVRIKVEDPHARLAVWTGDFERPAAEAAALQSEIGFRVAALMRSAADARRYSRGRISPAGLALYVQSRDNILLSPERSLAFAEQLVREAPDFAPGHGALCQGLLQSARADATDEFEVLKARAMAECHRALALDPHFGLPYIVLANAEPGRSWTRREAHLRRAQAVAPGPDADFGLGNLFTFSGRQEEGLHLVRRSVAVRPGWPIPPMNLASDLYGTGRAQEAREFAARQVALRPDDTRLRGVSLVINLFTRSPEEGLAILDDPGLRPGELGPATLEGFQAFLKARKTGSAIDRRAAVQAIAANARAMRLPRAYAVPMLSRLGELNAAFEVANAYADDPKVQRLAFALQPDFLFVPETAAMRADPRFIPLARKLGLLDYWRASGHWPDFCVREPGSICGAMQQTRG